MNWEQIMQKALEINELQQEILEKLKHPVIREIIVRNAKYHNKEKKDLKSLNNAVLEHQIMITPYLIIILEKIKALTLDWAAKSIYINIPEIEEEAEKYITELKKEYELMNNSLDLIIDIETLSSTEYEIKNNFENTQYAKKVKIGSELFEKELLNFPKMSSEMLKDMIIKRYQQYINALSNDDKKELLIETFALSYDKNVFEYFNKAKVIIKTMNEQNIFSKDSLELAYNKYEIILDKIERILLVRMSLQEIYDEFKIIYETDFFKQKIKQK